MTDIAQLGFEVDSSGLVQGNRALDEVARAADAAAKSAEKLERQYSDMQHTAKTATSGLSGALAEQEDRYRGIARRAMEYAESMRTANRSERGLAEEAREAALGIDMKAEVMRRAGTEQERMAARVKRLQESEERLARQQREAARATELQELNLRKLLGQIDPTIAKLDKLAQQEEQLEKALNLGAITPKVFDQYQAKIDTTRAATLNMGVATDSLTKSIGGLNLTSVETQQSIAALARAVATGQWGQAQSSITSLTVRTGIMTGAFTLAGAATAAVVAGVAALAVAWKQGNDRQFEFQRSLILTGDYANRTASGLMAATSELDRLAGVSRGNARSALLAVTESGRFTAAQFDDVARAAARMEGSLGVSVDRTVDKFEEIAKSPIDALLRLNETERLVTKTQLDRLIALEREGKEQQLVAEAIRIATDGYEDMARQAEATLPVTQRLWRDIKDEISGAWGELQIYMTLAERAARIRLVGGEDGGPGLASTFARSLLPSSRLRVINQWGRGRLSDLGERPDVQWAGIYAPGADSENLSAYRKVQEEQREAEKAAADAIASRLQGMDREAALLAERNKILQDYNRLAKDDPRHFDGSRERLLADAEKRIGQQFDRKDGVNKTDPADALIARLRRQIALNEEQVASEEKLSATERMLIEVRQELDRIGGKASATNRTLAETLMEEAKASGAAAAADAQRRRDLQAHTALVEQLTQAERVRREQAEIDLMGVGRGADATDQLRRQLDIQREYLREVEKLDRAQRNQNTAVSLAEYERQQQMLVESRDRMLEIERRYQSDRQQLLSDWRTGFTRVWEDYVYAASNASEQAAGLLANSLSGVEDAFVRMAKTGKLSFSDLADSIIADLARIAARQAITGLFGNVLGGLFGGSSAAPSASWAAGFGNNTGWLGGGREYGGDVNGHRAYRVGERNKPELLTTPAGQFLLPGDHGRVDPIRTAAAGGGRGMGTPQININVRGNANVESATARPNASGGFDVDMILKQVKGAIADDIASGGVVAQASRQRFGLRDQV